MAETLVLDPAAVAAGRTQLDITQYVAEAGPDWGDHQIEQYLAEAQFGQNPVDYRVPNRTVTIPLILLKSDALTFEQIRAKIQQKAALFQREGGWLMRQTSIGPIYADVINAQLHMGGSRAQALWGVDADAVLTLTCLPDWYGEEVVGATHTNSAGTTELSFVMGRNYFDTVLGYTPGLYWTLGVGGIIDRSGFSRSGTASGGVTVGGYSTTLPINGTDTATDFDGVDDCITSSYNPFTNGSNRTFMGWAYRDTSTSNDALFGSSSATAGTWVRLLLNTGSQDVAFTVNGATNSVTWTAAWPGNTQWVHWALTFDETTDTAELFINGVSKGTKTVAQAYNATPGNLLIGAFANSADPFDGKMDEFAVYQKVMTEGEIRTIYQAAQSEALIGGNYPARTRIVVSELDGVDQRGLLWGVRNRYYDAAATAQLVYEADKLTPRSPAAVSAYSLASGGYEVLLASLGTSWTPILSTDLAGVGALTHKGSYRVWARVRSTYPNVSLRLSWDVGDLVLPQVNPEVTLSLHQNTTPNYNIVDLGKIRLNAAPLGTHRWNGLIQAVNGSGGAVAIDKVWFQPIDEGGGLLTAPINTTVGVRGYSAHDEFDQTTGNLGGKTLPLGGTWSTTGDAVDITVESAAGHIARRSEANDANMDSGRYAIAGTTVFTDVAAQVTLVTTPFTGTNQRHGLLLRYTDTSNWLRVDHGYGTYGGGGTDFTAFVVRKMVAGVGTDLVGVNAVISAPPPWYVRAAVTASGMIYVWLSDSVTDYGSPVIVWQDAALATGGALASGKAGFYDASPGAGSGIRDYDDFAAWVPDINSVMFPNRSAELRSDGMYREAKDGGYYGPVSNTIGDFVRIPPATIEARPTEILLKPSAGDFDSLPDTAISRISAQVRYRPTYLFVPEG